MNGKRRSGNKEARKFHSTAQRDDDQVSRRRTKFLGVATTLARRAVPVRCTLKSDRFIYLFFCECLTAAPTARVRRAKVVRIRKLDNNGKKSWQRAVWVVSRCKKSRNAEQEDPAAVGTDDRHRWLLFTKQKFAKKELN